MNLHLVDSHCHFNLMDHAQTGDVNAAIQSAKILGVQEFLCVSVTLEDFPEVLSIAEQHPEVYASVGLHPNEVATQEPTVDELVKLASPAKVIAIGETGLDYYRTDAAQPWQQTRFRTHIQAGHQTNLPIIIHSRDAETDTLQIAKEEAIGKIGGVLHCFTGSLNMAERAIEMGLLISFSGIVTFKNATDLQAIAKHIPLEYLLVETDAPYLAPIPHRGKTNQPAYVRHVAEYLAELKEVSLAEIATQTTKNFHKLFLKKN